MLSVWSIAGLGTRVIAAAIACIALLASTTARAATVVINNQVVVEADDWWQEIPSPFANTKELIGGRAANGTIQARASITTLKASSDQAALARLQREARWPERPKLCACRASRHSGSRTKWSSNGEFRIFRLLFLNLSKSPPSLR